MQKRNTIKNSSGTFLRKIDPRARGVSPFLNLLIYALIFITIFGTVPVQAESAKTQEYSLADFYQIMRIIEENYAYDVSRDELIEGAIQGLFNNLDEHSGYYTKEEFESLMKDVYGDFVGIGVIISESQDGEIVVVEPIEDGPAYKAGVKAGDEIISVDGKSTLELSTQDIVDLITGEVGTKVKIGVKRSGKTNPLYFNIPREEIEINPVSHTTINKDIGYIRIAQFSNNTNEKVTKVLKEFDKAGISNIIIDLRDNPGGLLTEVVDVSKHFIPKGPIVHISHKGEIIEAYNSNNAKPKYNLVVLVNENSASASEIFAGAVQDTKVGTIIGVTTYGKGTVQQILPLSNGDGIKLTIAEYLTPNKRNINGKGVVPDIIVEANAETSAKDTQLEKAIELFK